MFIKSYLWTFSRCPQQSCLLRVGSRVLRGKSWRNNFNLHPGKLTWNLQITHLERKMIFQTSMIMFHVNLPGCNLSWFFLVGLSSGQGWWYWFFWLNKPAIYERNHARKSWEKLLVPSCMTGIVWVQGFLAMCLVFPWTFISWFWKLVDYRIARLHRAKNQSFLFSL